MKKISCINPGEKFTETFTRAIKNMSKRQSERTRDKSRTTAHPVKMKDKAGRF